MRQFDVYDNPDGATRGLAPALVLVSSPYLLSDTVLVAPILPRPASVEAVEVAVILEGAEHALALMLMTALPAVRLRRRAGDLTAHEDAIRRGLERLFTGF